MAPVATSAYLIWKLAIALELIAPESLQKLVLIRIPWGGGGGQTCNKKILQHIDITQLEPCFGGTLDVNDTICRAKRVMNATIGTKAVVPIKGENALAAASSAAAAVAATPKYLSSSLSSTSSLSSEESRPSIRSRLSSMGTPPKGSSSRLARARSSRGLSVETEYKLKSTEEHKFVGFGFESVLEGIGRNEMEVMEGLLMRNESLVIADATKKGYPIIYCPPSFCELTGYSATEVVGRNCRFLQGEGTDQ